MHEANFELIDIPHVRQSGKNSADIRMVVDALDLCYTKSHVNTFVPSSAAIRTSRRWSASCARNAKTVIGVGVKNSTSDLLISTCDEFIYYDDLIRERKQRKPARAKAQKKKSSGSGDRMQEGIRPDAGDRRSPQRGAGRPGKTVGFHGQAGAEAPPARLQRKLLRL